MKKFLTLAIALVAIVSQAASIDWKVTAKRNTFIWDSNDQKFTGTAYLILQEDLAGLTAGSFNDLKIGLATKQLDSISFSNGAYAVSQRTATASDSVLDAVDGGEYLFQLLLLDEENSKYALAGTAKEVAYRLGVDKATLIGFTDQTVGAGAAAGGTTWYSLGSGGDTPAVPEPATGALALAGLALLFRRKRV